MPRPLNDRGAVHRFRFERVRKIPLAPILLPSRENQSKGKGDFAQTNDGGTEEEEDRRHKSLGGVAARGEAASYPFRVES